MSLREIALLIRRCYTPIQGPVMSAAPIADTMMVSPQLKASVGLLVIDDERTLRESCRTVLDADGYKVEVCGRGDEALQLLQRRSFDIILTDLYMQGVSGMDLLEAALAANPGTIVIMMTGNPSVASNIQALRAGAWDYIPKPFSATHLRVLIGRATHAVMVARESGALSPAAPDTDGRESSVLGVSPGFTRVLDLARRVASTDASVFITGESGSGKEMIAQFIHAHSRRRVRSIVAINCASLPEGL